MLYHFSLNNIWTSLVHLYLATFFFVKINIQYLQWYFLCNVILTMDFSYLIPILNFNIQGDIDAFSQRFLHVLLKLFCFLNLSLIQDTPIFQTHSSWSLIWWCSVYFLWWFWLYKGFSCRIYYIWQQFRYKF